MSIFSGYFPLLTPRQEEQFSHMEALYLEWNARINVISRKDTGRIRVHHILHSLAIAAFTTFRDGTAVLDAGTGGGLPGIPLAVMFPGVHFTLADSIGKKITVAGTIARELGLDNLTAVNARFESLGRNFDFVTGRAVSNLSLFFSMVSPLVKPAGFNDRPNGILYLTGGDIEADLDRIPSASDIYPLSDLFREDYFATKKLVHLYNF